MDNWMLIGEAMLAVIVLASLVVRLTPTPKDDAWLAKALVRLSAIWPWGGLKLPVIQGMPKNED